MMTWLYKDLEHGIDQVIPKYSIFSAQIFNSMFFLATFAMGVIWYLAME